MTPLRGKAHVAHIRQCSTCGSRSTDAAGLVQAMRLQAGLTQSELARRMGIAQSRVVRIEQQGPNVRLTTLQRAAQACGLTMVVGYDIDVIEKQAQDTGYDSSVIG